MIIPIQIPITKSSHYSQRPPILTTVPGDLTTNSSNIIYDITHGDGTREVMTSDGTVTFTYLDTSQKIIKNDGTEIRIDSDGNKTTQLPDGTIIKLSTDGTRTESQPDGTYIEQRTDEYHLIKWPDGSQKETFPNKSTKEILTDGTIIFSIPGQFNIIFKVDKSVDLQFFGKSHHTTQTERMVDLKKGVIVDETNTAKFEIFIEDMAIVHLPDGKILQTDDLVGLKELKAVNTSGDLNAVSVLATIAAGTIQETFQDGVKFLRKTDGSIDKVDSSSVQTVVRAAIDESEYTDTSGGSSSGGETSGGNGNTHSIYTSITSFNNSQKQIHQKPTNHLNTSTNLHFKLKPRPFIHTF